MKSPAFSFYVRDWICSATIARMTGEQVKAYMYLLCAAWLQDEVATLPADDESLAAFARVDPATWERIKPLIMTKFEASGNGRVYNDRQMAEHMKQQNKSIAGAQREHNRRTARAQNKHNGSTQPSTALEAETEAETASLQGSEANLGVNRRTTRKTK